MISKKSIEAMAAKLGITIDATAWESTTEVDVTIPDVKIVGADESVFTAAQLNARDNIKYNEGKDAGEEMAVKAVKEANGLSFQGKKVEGLFKHIKEQATPDESETLKALRNNLTAAEQAKEAAINQMGAMEKAQAVRGFIPALNNGMTQKEAEAILYANGYDFVKDGSSWKVTKDGQPVKDAKMLTDVAPDVVVTGFFTERKFVGAVEPAAKVGRAGTTSTTPNVGGPAGGTIAEVQAAWEAEHGAGSANSSAYATHLESKMKEAADAGTELK